MLVIRKYNGPCTSKACMTCCILYYKCAKECHVQERFPVATVQKGAACHMNQGLKAFSRKSFGNSSAKRLLHIPFFCCNCTLHYSCARETESRMQHHETQTVVYEHAQKIDAALSVVAVILDHE